MNVWRIMISAYPNVEALSGANGVADVLDKVHIYNSVLEFS